MLVVALAWYAGELLLNQSRSEHAKASDLLGLAPSGRTELAELAEAPQPGWGRVLLGAPSGAPRRARPADLAPPDEPGDQPSTPSPTDEPQPDLEPSGGEPAPGPLPPPRWPADLELTVRPGQSLSKIVAQSYGRSTDDLVRRLASYNGLSNPDRLRAGQDLRVPVREKLLASTDEQ